MGALKNKSLKNKRSKHEKFLRFLSFPLEIEVSFFLSGYKSLYKKQNFLDNLSIFL